MKWLIVLVLVAFLAPFLLRGHDETRVDANDTTTTVLSDNAAPSLPDSFASFTDGARRAAVARSKALRVKPTRSGLFNAAYASEVAQIVREVFARFGSVVVDQALRVAWCESRMIPTARNGQHIGVFQLAYVHRDRAARLGYQWSQMQDARPNATVAADLWSETHSWQAWECQP